MSGKSILDLKAGELGRIGAIDGVGSTRQRLLDMGLLPRQEIRIERFAPGGAPVWVKLNGQHIALRRSEAAMVRISEALVESDEPSAAAAQQSGKS